MKRFFAFSLLLLFASMTTLHPQNRVPKTLVRWQDGNNVNWKVFEKRCSGVRGEDWRDKFPQLVETIDTEKADELWKQIQMAKAAFHQDNLWILTSGSDSLVAAMVDVEWAFDGMFVMNFIRKPNSGGGHLKSTSGSAAGNVPLAVLYNESVARRIKELLSISGWEYNENCDSVRFAESVKIFCIYNTVRWNDSDSLVEECPARFFKIMGKGHQHADVRTEWCRIQNALRLFRDNTQWLRDKNNKKLNNALDDFETSLLSCFSKYTKNVYSSELSMSVYGEIVPMAVDVLCMEYMSAVKDEKK